VAEVNFEVRNIKEQLDYMAENYPNKVAFIFHMNDGLKLTYSDLKDRSYMLARNFMSLGLNKGDRIALLLPNTYEIVISYFASALAGLIVVPFDVSYGLEQADHILKTTEPSAFVLYNCVEYQSLISDLFPELNSCTLNSFKSNRYPSLRIAIVVDDHENKISKKFPSAWSYSDLESKQIDKETKEFPYVDPDDIFAILPTVN
jgi:fatty-acyl-CoA synthase